MNKMPIRKPQSKKLPQRRIRCINQAHSDNWSWYHGDSVEILQTMPSDKTHYTIYSPPFSSLYTYSNSERDMGNSRNDGQFMDHYKFLVSELLRITMPGRLLSFHCMNFPTLKERDGVIGIRDFRGELIRMHVEAGWIYHSEVCIWKDPVISMQRTKALGLLHKQLKKDSCMSRQGIPDYVVTMRKPGDNPERVEHTNESFPVQVWQRYASPVWASFSGYDEHGFLVNTSSNNAHFKSDGSFSKNKVRQTECGSINPSDTLQRESARESEDEKHVCPLQLTVIQRCVELWSNPNDVVLSPFGGIASEGFQSIKMGRKFIGVELKESYWVQGKLNLMAAERQQMEVLI